MKIICGIYKIISPSKRIYIGQSINIFKRWGEYKNLRKNKNYIIYNSINKYGYNKHKFEILHQCEKTQLNELEKYYVDLFQTFNTKHGMNLRDGGGSRGELSLESRMKISKFHKGRKYEEGRIGGMSGKHHSEDARKRMSIARIGNKYALGKKHPNRKRPEISANHSMSLRVKVIQYDKNMNFIKTFKSIKFAEDETGIWKTNIGRVCMGKVKTAGGFIWKYDIA